MARARSSKRSSKASSSSQESNLNPDTVFWASTVAAIGLFYYHFCNLDVNNIVPKVKEILTPNGNGQLYDLTLMLYILEVCELSRAVVGNKHWLENLVTVSFVAFGGGLLVPLLLNQSGSYLDESNLTKLIIGWWISYGLPSEHWEKLYNQTVLRNLGRISMNIIIVHFITTSCGLAGKGTIVPIACGTCAGASGLLLPLSEGLRNLTSRKGMASELQNALLISTLFWVLTVTVKSCNCLGLDWSKLGQDSDNMKMALSIFGIIQTYFPGKEDAILDPIYGALQSILRLP